MPKPQLEVIRKVDRTPSGIVDALFDAMDALRENSMSAEDVRGLSHTARTIVNVARLELDAARLAEMTGRKVEFKTLPGLGPRSSSSTT